MALPYRATKSLIKPPLGYTDLRHPVFNNCVAAYLFNEGGGPVVRDIARGRRIPLTGTYNWTEGPHGSAINFNGGTGSGNTDKLDPLTIAMWINVSTIAPGNQIFLDKVNSSVNAGWYCNIANNFGAGQIQFNFCNSGGIFRSQTASFSPNVWHFVFFWWDQTGHNAGTNTQIWVDGILQTNVGGASVGTVASDSGIPLIIGTTFDGSSFPLVNGQVGAVFMWNRILSNAEGQDLYLNTYPSIYPRYVLGAPPPAENFAATAATKAGTLGRNILVTLAAAKHTFAGVLTTFFQQFETLTATAAQKTGSLIAFKAISQVSSAHMLQRSATLGREVLKTIAATRALYAGVLSTIKSATQTTLTATKATFAGALTFNTGVALLATKAFYQGKLTLAVQHGPPPPSVCTPTACPTVSDVISHVEICENPGS